MTSESTGYRFQEPSGEITHVPDAAVVHVVEFYPSLDDYVAVAELQAKKYQTLRSSTKIGLQIFLGINFLTVPAVLFFFDYAFLAIAALATNVLFGLLLLPALMRQDYRQYYRFVYGDDLENELVRVELSEDGLLVRHLADSSFYSWRSVTGIEDRKESIFVHLRASTLPIRKSGFAYDELQQNFLHFARERFAETKQAQLPS